MTRRKEVKFATTRDAEVEVTCDAEGSKGAWYEATVARVLPKRGRYAVVYNSLMSDADGSTPLRESVNWSQVRPRPPRDRAVPFDLHQAVDAYYSDGWWVGVVSKVHGEEGEHGKERYTVYFPIFREELEFGLEELRVHRDWVNGEWVLPHEQGAVDTIYSIGNQVEVARIKENYRTAWFPATIVQLILKTCFLVEYESLRTDDGTDSLREIVDSQYVRPCPPYVSDVKSFKLLDKVEAFYGDGWWAGLVMKIDTGSRYNVRCWHWEREMKFSRAELRPHQDWINGRWVRASRDKITKSRSQGTSKSIGRGRRSYARKNARKPKIPILVMTSSDGEGKSLEESHTYNTNSIRKNVEGSTFQSQPDSSQPSKKLKEGEAIDASSLLDEFMMASGAKTPTSVGTGCDATMPLPKDRICFHYKPSMRKRPVSKRPSKENSAARPHMLAETPSDISVGELNDEPLMPAKLNRELLLLNRTEWPNMGKIFTERGRNGSENQSKAPKVCHSSFTHGSNGLLQQKKKFVAHCPRQRGEVPFDGGAGQFTNKRKRTGNRGRHAEIRITDKKAPLGGALSVTAASGKLSHELRSLFHGAKERGLQYSPLTMGNKGGSVGDDVLKVHLFSDQKDNMEVGMLSDEGHLTSQQAGTTQGDSCVKDLATKEFSYVNASLVEISNLNIQLNEAGREAENEDLRLPLRDEVTQSFNIENMEVAKLSDEGPFTSQLEGTTQGDSCVEDLATEELSYVNASLVEISNLNIQLNEAGREAENEDLRLPLRDEVTQSFNIENMEVAKLSDEGPFTSQLEGTTQGDLCVKDLATEELSYVNASLVEISNLNIQLNESGQKADNEVLRLPFRDEVIRRVENDISPCSLPSKKTCLPFVKCSFLWESLESMEIFSKVLQQPHFRPLEQYSEEFREGMAIGLMVTFAKLLESIRKLRIFDFQDKFEERWKTLIHLEEHGFDVQCARGRLEELRRIKGDQEQLVDKKSALEVLLLERQKEKGGLRAKTEEIDLTIMELEQSLVHFHEKKASIVKQREDYEAEIVKLQINVRAVEKVFLFVEHDFESALSAAW